MENITERQHPAIADLVDKTAKAVGMLTRKEAWETGICVKCRESALPRCYSEAGKKEYRISGLCEVCFDEICG